MVEIKTPEQIAKMREAGLVVAAIHAATREAAVPGATTKDLDEVAAQGDRRARREVELPRLRRASPRPSAPRSTRSSSTASRTTRPSSRTATSSPSTPARSSTAGTATPRTPPSSAPVTLRSWSSCQPGDRGVHVGRASPRSQGQPARRHLQGDRVLHPPPAPPGRRQVRHRRGLRRPRHRHRDAHGPAPAELRRRASAARAPSWCPASAWRSSRWSPSAPPQTQVLEDDWTVKTTTAPGPRTGSTRSP